ncbi:MAG TPA: sialidase family protein [Blastocatellia bacterium]|nr:sialidase family protein [Blastocatellia bacterium]
MFGNAFTRRIQLVTLAVCCTAASILGHAAQPAKPTVAQSPPPSFNTDITFSNNTLADFSATSGEPMIRVDKQDNVFISSPFGLSTTVSLLWRSSDGGRSFMPMGTPIIRDSATAPGGGDTDQDVDDNNWFYFVDLSGACITAAVSTDGGNTFPPERTNSIVCVSDENPGAAADDRQWVAAIGNGVAYVTWRNLTGSNFWLFKTTDGGLTWDKGRLVGTVSGGGPLRVDKQVRRVTVNGVEKDAVILYQLFDRGTNLRVFRIMDFLDGSPMKVDDLSIVNPGVSVTNVIPTLAVDRAGNLYASWSQTASSIWMASSTDRGQTWSPPRRVSPPTLTGTNIMSWIVAGDPGRVDVVWYRSPVAGNPVDNNSVWDVYMAQSINVLDASPTFTTVKVSQNIIHRGQICLDGLNCDLAVPMQDRSFLEFPSVAIDSKGAAVITYNDNSNQVQGPYVMFAKQVSGPSLFASVGYLKGDPGAVGVATPSAGETIKTPAYTLTGTHTIPPKNFDKDESGDARFPDHGPAIGSNVAALDIKGVWLNDDADSVTVTMQMADLTTAALATAPALSGGDGVLYLTQMDINDRVYWVGAEVRGGVARYLTGSLGMLKSATSKKFVTYNPDAASSLSVQGSISNTAPGTITMKLPRSLVGGPAAGSKAFSVTGYAFSERGPLGVMATSDGNPTSLPLQIDASAAATYTFGEGPRLDGVVEVSLDDASFSAPRMATLLNVTGEGRWQLSLNPADLIPGAHTLYARQRINGREPSMLATVPFNVSQTIEQIVNSLVSLQTSNPSSAGGVSAFNLSMQNTSQQTIFAPLRAQISGLSSASGQVTAANADNLQVGAGAYWDYSNRVGSDAQLSAGEVSGARSLRFNNPNNEPFSVTFNVVGNLARTNGGVSMMSRSTSDGSSAAASRSTTSNGTASATGALVGSVFKVTYNPLLNLISVEIIQ